MPDLRFLHFILLVCIASNIFVTLTSVMIGSRSLKSHGLIFDIVYSILCSLNLVSDVIMFNALKKPKEQETKVKLRLFLIWNTATTCIGYITDIFLGDFNSKYVEIKKENLKGSDEESFRTKLFYFSVLFSTVVFAVKGGILYAIYQIYTNYDQLVSDDHLGAQGVRGPLFGTAQPTAFMFQQGSQLGVPVSEAQGPAVRMIPPPAVPYAAAPGWSPVAPAYYGQPQDPRQPYYVAFQQPRFPIQQPQLEQPLLHPGTEPYRVVYIPYRSDAVSSQPMLELPITVIEESMAANRTAEDSTAQPAVGEPTAAVAVDPQVAPHLGVQPQSKRSQNAQVPAGAAQATTTPDTPVQATAEQAMFSQKTQGVATTAGGAASKTSSAPVPTASSTESRSESIESATYQAASAQGPLGSLKRPTNAADRDAQAESAAAVDCFSQDRQNVLDQPSDKAEEEERVNSAAKKKE